MASGPDAVPAAGGRIMRSFGTPGAIAHSPTCARFAATVRHPDVEPSPQSVTARAKANVAPRPMTTAEIRQNAFADYARAEATQ